MSAIDFDRSFRLTGREIVRLQRQHGVTIRDLAIRTGFPQWKVRRVREFGVRGFAALDWHEAIAGELTPRMRAALRQRQI